MLIKLRDDACQGSVLALTLALTSRGISLGAVKKAGAVLLKPMPPLQEEEREVVQSFDAFDSFVG